MEVGVKEISKKKLVRSTCMGWSCRKMADETLAKRADAQKIEGKSRRGRPEWRRGLHCK